MKSIMLMDMLSNIIDRDFFTDFFIFIKYGQISTVWFTGLPQPQCRQG